MLLHASAISLFLSGHIMNRFQSLPLRACAVLAIAASASTAFFTPVVEAVTWNTLDGKPPLVIGHRGASGYVPEHTLESYRLAIAMGADVIEPDLVSTKDGVLIARHEPMLSGTTNVASIAKFANRKRTSVIDGVSYTDWFSVDFTLAEIKELRAIERVSDRNQTFNGAFEIVTLQDVIDLAKKESTRTGRTISIYPETKHPTWHNAEGKPLEAALVSILNAAGWTKKTDPVFIQSFEIGNLKQLRSMTGVRLVQLLSCYDNDLATGNCIYIPLDADSAPGDWIAANDRRTYADMITPAGLAEIARYADGVGPWKRQFMGVKALSLGPDGKPVDFNGDGVVNEADGVTVKNSNLVADAHAAKLFVHPYTFRTDRIFARDYAGGGSGKAAVNAEYRQMWALGVDGLFTDFSNDAVASRALFAADQVEVIEYANAVDAKSATRFFRTASDADIKAVAGAKGLTRTADSFKVWLALQSSPVATTAICRYYDSRTSRHFYNIESTRCAAYATSGYSNEGTAFYAVATTPAGTCAAGTVAVYRHVRTVNAVTDERLSAAQSIVDTTPPYSNSGIAFCAAQ
jgi:glycerophosphoryl diester phosphodiesterase